MSFSDAAVADALARAQAHVRLPPLAARRSIRERAGLSQEAVATALGTSGATISRWETGQAIPRGRRLVRYVDLLASLADLIPPDNERDPR